MYTRHRHTSALTTASFCHGTLWRRDANAWLWPPQGRTWGTAHERAGTACCSAATAASTPCTHARHSSAKNRRGRAVWARRQGRRLHAVPEATSLRHMPRPPAVQQRTGSCARLQVGKGCGRSAGSGRVLRRVVKLALDGTAQQGEVWQTMHRYRQHDTEVLHQWEESRIQAMLHGGEGASRHYRDRCVAAEAPLCAEG
jgi:hypothetical protein